MPETDYNIGRDVTLDIIDPTEGELRFPIITGWDKNARTQELESRPLSGEVLFRHIPDGWEGTFDIDRATGDLDRWYADREARYFNGQRLDNVSITETISEVNGSISVYRYTNVSMTMSGAGAARGNEKITQRISWRASRRERVA